MMSPIIRLTLVVSILTAIWGGGHDCLAQNDQTEKPKSHKSSADEIPWSLSSQSDQPAKDKKTGKDKKESKRLNFRGKKESTWRINVEVFYLDEKGIKKAKF